VRIGSRLWMSSKSVGLWCGAPRGALVWIVLMCALHVRCEASERLSHGTMHLGCYCASESVLRCGPSVLSGSNLDAGFLTEI